MTKISTDMGKPTYDGMVGDYLELQALMAPFDGVEPARFILIVDFLIS